MYPFTHFGCSRLNDITDSWATSPIITMQFNYSCSIDSIMIICAWILFIILRLCRLLTYSVKVVVYASNFNSIKPTQLLPDSHENATFTEPPKHSLFVLTESLLTDLRSMYARLYATPIENGIIELQSTCRKYSHVFMNGKKLTSSEQEVPYVLAIPPLESSDVARPFRIEYFIKHSVLLPMSDTSSTFLFAVGRWPQQHPRQHVMGKPDKVWCLSTYESALNSFVPVSSIQGRAIVATECVDDEDVIVNPPLPVVYGV